MTSIESITIRGFKSIKQLDDFKPGRINIFIGQNGAGKSNLISFFRLLANIVSGAGNLGNYTGKLGGASELLFDGPETTQQLFGQLAIRTDSGINNYRFRLTHASGDQFIFTDESFKYTPINSKPDPRGYRELGAGHRESNLVNDPPSDITSSTILQILRRLIVYQFHNTTFNSPIRNNKSDIHAGWFLFEDGRNLAAVLYELRNNQPSIYRQVVSILQLIIPFFSDFELYEEYSKVYLRWRELESEKVFVATHASDGMLRAMALVTLLCLPPNRLPSVMFIDEPELGLHPSAIAIICGLFQSVSEHCQVFIATQNADMLNEFDIKDIVVVSRDGRESIYTRLNEDEYSEWLADYSLSDLWNRNIIGGRP